MNPADSTPQCNCASACGTQAQEAPPPHDNAQVSEAPVQRSVFRLPGMDCPSEEQMVRLRLGDSPVVSLAFDLPGRRLVVDHRAPAADILQRLVPLGYGAELVDSTPLPRPEESMYPQADAHQAQVLWVLLGLNALMFVVEGVAGWWAGSAGLIADAADMFSDAAVYGLALYAVGRTAGHKLAAARFAGMVQLLIAVGALTETGRRVLTGGLPEELAMIGVSVLALAANVACLVLLARHRHEGVHMRASFIFSSNDVMANLGVIVSGILVAWTGSALPDWIIGTLIAVMVLIGALRILRLR